MAQGKAQHRYCTSVRWERERRGVLSSEGKPDLEVATPPEFKGHEGVWSPEDMLVGALETCIMLTFLYYADRAGVELKSYQSECEGTLQMGSGGMSFSDFTVQADITVAAEEQVEAAREAIGKAESACLITRSLDGETSVTVEAEVAVRAD
ncbi:MAG: OsmC family protein [Candidatus Brocadiia bacterium]